MDERPKCVRLIVTAMYADGTSALVDIKNPDTCEIEFVHLTLDTPALPYQNFRVVPDGTRLDLRVSTKINPREPAIISGYPTNVQILQ